jgi:hypothetical protein
MGKRDYAREYQIEKPERRKERAERNGARREMARAVGKAALKGKEVDHRDGNAFNRAKGNLRVVTKAANNNGRRGGPAKGR